MPLCTAVHCDLLHAMSHLSTLYLHGDVIMHQLQALGNQRVEQLYFTVVG